MENGEPFPSDFTANKCQPPSGQSPKLGKRKRTGQGKKGSPKRRKNESDNEGSDTDMDDTDMDNDDSEAGDSESASSRASSNDEDNDEQEEADAMNDEDEVTEGSLKTWIKEGTNMIETLQTKLKSDVRVSHSLQWTSLISFPDRRREEGSRWNSQHHGQTRQVADRKEPRVFLTGASSHLPCRSMTQCCFT